MQPATLVTPPNPRPHEHAYWERAEALAQQFVAGLPQPLAEEVHFALWCFCMWPIGCSGGRAWAGWDYRFDSALMARLDGRDLLLLGLDEVQDGWDPDAIVDGLRDFVRWLGAFGHVDGEHAERICTEIEFARETWILSVASVQDDPWIHVAGEGGCPCCAANEAVAPFVTWLRDTTGASLLRLLMAQALAIVALEQLGLTALVSGGFYRLELGACLDQVYARSDLEEHERSELTAVARAFATYLGHRCGLSGTHKRRMQNEAERWAATPAPERAAS
jgi:hypothetical protein